MSVWEYFTVQNPEAGQRFSQAIASLSSAHDACIISEYDFSMMQTIADIGGANGSLLIATLQANPHLRGVLFDLPPIIEEAQKHLSGSEIAARCQLEAGSFFEIVPAGMDAYLMRYILHDWNDENAVQILKNCRKFSPNANVLIIEHLIQPEKNARFTLAHDLLMLIGFGDAKERTKEEYRL